MSMARRPASRRDVPFDWVCWLVVRRRLPLKSALRAHSARCQIATGLSL